MLTLQIIKLNEEDLMSYDTESLRSFFSNQFVVISRSHPLEAFRLLGEVIAYIVEIKLENTTSTSPTQVPTSHGEPFELWVLVLDRGIISGVQVREGESFRRGFN